MDVRIETHVRINDFRIIKTLGTGGMGIVYLARQMSLDRDVALKVLGPTIDDPMARARFRRESRAVALLKHPGIAELYYAGQDDTLCYMATEYIDGATLRQVFTRLAAARDATITLDSVLQRQHDDEVERPEIRFDHASEEADDTLVLHESVSGEAESVTPEAEQIIGSKAYIRRCCEFVRDAALALDHAHQQGVIHRDIKPENLMLDRKGAVRIIDFGVARFRDDVSLSQTGALVGTPMYMSPETITGRVNIEHRSDIFSLGVVLYEALTLRPPYSASTREGIFQKIVSQAMPPVSWRNRAVSRELEAVVHKAIARDPDDRYQSAAGFAGDLQDHLDGKQVIAAPYRYKTDEREIAVSRPIHAIFVSIGFLLLFVMSSGSHLTLLLDVNGKFLDRRQISYDFMTLWGCANLILFWFFWGWLRGLPTPIYLSSGFSGLLFIWHYYDTYIKDNGSHVDKNVGDFVTYFIMNCFFLLATALPFAPKTRGWLRNAKALRSEHRRLRRRWTASFRSDPTG